MRFLFLLAMGCLASAGELRADWLRPWTWFGGEAEPKLERAGQKGWKSLELSLATEPAQIKLSQNRRVEVKLTLRNRGKRTVNLQFPTSQRYEILVKEAGGGTLVRWSEDRAFAPVLGGMILNPGEMARFTETVSLRELKAGGEYTLEVYFPAYPEVRQSLSLKPGS